MSTRSGRLVLASMAVVAFSGVLLAQNSRAPAVATLSDRPGDKIRSDGLGSYLDAQQCVIAWVDKGGFFFLRTVAPNCAPATRQITLDFSDAVSRPATCPAVVNDQYGNPLDLCGPNTVRDVRVIAQSLFKDTALANGTNVTLPFSLQADFSSTGFELDFEQSVPVSGSGTVRVLDAASTAVAELYQYVKQGKRTAKVSQGRYRMPFQLQVVKQ